MKPLTLDTSPEVERRQIDGWRRMSMEEKGATIIGLSRAAREMARAGVRARYPGASPREEFLRLAIVTLGYELASRAYPDVADLNAR